MWVRKEDMDRIANILQMQSESLDRQLKMINDLIRATQLTHDRLTYLEQERF